MTRTIKMILAVTLAALGVFWGTGIASASGAGCGACTNQQTGDNSASKDQKGHSNSGAAVGGQVAGIVSSGDASVDAKNRSERVDLTSGTVTSENSSASFVGLNSSTTTTVSSAATATALTATNQQVGDNSFDLTQAIDANSGDAVGGEVIGVVTAAGGKAAVVADNASKRIDITTGNADAQNESAAFVGLNTVPSATLVTAGTALAGIVTNQQEGDNDLTGSQDSHVSTGDGVGGQVLGVVAGGNTKLDAKNRSERIDITTGDASAENSSAAFVGLNSSSSTGVTSDVLGAGTSTALTASNQQEGDNTGDFTQAADATSGDGVAGQVAGVVTSAGGSADAVLDNSSLRIDSQTGPSTFENTDELFVGLNVNTNTLSIGP